MTFNSGMTDAFLNHAFMHRGVDAAVPPSRLFDFSLFGSDSSHSSTNSDDSSSSSSRSSSSGSLTAPSIERRDDQYHPLTQLTG
jgi:hypothetical protein